VQEQVCEIGAPFAIEGGVGPHMFALRVDQARDLRSASAGGASCVARGGLDRLPEAQEAEDEGPLGAFGAGHDSRRNLISVFGTGFWDASFRACHIELDGKAFTPSGLLPPKPQESSPRTPAPGLGGGLRRVSGGSGQLEVRSAPAPPPPRHRRTSPDDIYSEHSDTTTCVAVSECGSWVATGSVDCCVCIWRVGGCVPEEGQGGSEVRAGSGPSPAPPQLPSGGGGGSGSGGGSGGGGGGQQNRLRLDKVLFGHDDVVTCVAVRSALDLVFSTSLDGTCILHTLERGAYLRSIAMPSAARSGPAVPIRRAAAPQAPSPSMSAYSSSLSSGWSWVGFSHPAALPVLNVWWEEELSLHAYSVNGRLLSTAKLNSPLHSFCYSFDGALLACASKHRAVHVFDALSLRALCVSPPLDKQVTSLSCLAGRYVFVIGLADGSLSNLKVFG
jgi:hypothetical protein